MNSRITDLYKDLDFEQAVSHRIHTRIFEILGYLSSIDKNTLPEEERRYLFSAEELSKSLITELHSIIDFYKEKED
jgi:hypothetical protein